MMLIKGKRATVQTGAARSNLHNHSARVETAKHWPGLLPTAYPDPSLIYGVPISQTPLTLLGQGG
jgi:hypothetical protein